MQSLEKISFASILGPYKLLIEQELNEQIPLLGEKTPLRNACEYALLNGGKRFRPALVLMIAKALGYGVDVLQSAMGVEFFHTASLIADDLPCMDDDKERRNMPTTHLVYGESVALLATYGLISAGYGCLAKNARLLEGSAHPFAAQRDHLCLLALENAADNTGLSGTTGGQFLDLAPPNLSLSLVREIIQKKSGTLFEISFVFGWLFGGGNPSFLAHVKKSAAHFGMAFQIVDDFEDRQQDALHGHALNVANILGKDAAKVLFYEEINQFYETIKKLNLQGSDLQSLAQLLEKQVESF